MLYRWQPGAAQQRRKQVALQAKSLLAEGCVLLDTETTGLDYEAQVCEIAILDAAGNTLMDTLVKPTHPIPEGASQIHGISDEMVATAPSWAELADQYAAIVAGRTVVAYNAVFDDRLIRQSHEAHGREAPVINAVCAMHLFSLWNGQWDKHRERWRWMKLIEVGDTCGVAETGAHRAAADARMALGLLRFMGCSTSGRKPKAPRVR